MKRFKKLGFFLIILSALSFSGSNAYALNVFKLDLTRIPTKFGDWIQKQADNFENAMKEIAESQFAQFIGNGIQAAKEGIAFAKEKVQEVKDVINKPKEVVDMVKDSTAYKIAMLSATAAAATGVLTAIKKDRDTQIAEKESEYEVQKVTLTEKLKEAEENYNIGLEILNNELEELNKTKDEEKIKLKKEEIEEFKEANKGAIEQIRTGLGDIEEASTEEIKSLKKEYSLKILAQSAVIAAIGVEIGELLNLQNIELGKAEKDPKKRVKEAADELSYKEGDVITLEQRQEKKRKRKNKGSNAAMSAFSYGADVIASGEEIKTEAELTNDVSGTYNGKSESLQTAIKLTIAQLDALHNYLMIELKVIELETIYLLSKNSDYKVNEQSSVIDVCEYEVEVDEEQEDDGNGNE